MIVEAGDGWLLTGLFPFSVQKLLQKSCELDRYSVSDVAHTLGDPNNLNAGVCRSHQIPAGFDQRGFLLD